LVLPSEVFSNGYSNPFAVLSRLGWSPTVQVSFGTLKRTL